MLWAVAAALAGAMYLLLRETYLFGAVPTMAENARARGRRDVALRTLERVAAAPSLFGESLKREPRYKLAWLYLQAGRHDEAIGQCRTVLSGRLAPSTEANFRRRMADCLEAAGRAEEADAERARATELLGETPSGPDALVAQGRLLADKRRYTDAAAALEQAYSLIPENNLRGRAQVAAKLALCHWEAGRPERAAEWAETVLRLEPTMALRTTAHSIAGLAYSNLAQYELAVHHKQEAVSIDLAAGNREQAAKHLGSLAEEMRKQGRLAEAMQACEQASALSMEGRRIARMAQYECLRTWGRFAEAREMLEQARSAPPHAVPSAERRSQAIIALGEAWLDLEERKPEQALARLEEARPELGADEKLGLVCEATETWALALLGRTEEAREHAARTEAMAASRPYSRSSLLGAEGMLGQAAFELGETGASRAHWQRYLALQPDPVMSPKAHFYLGECAARDADYDGARSAYRAAIATGMDTDYTRRARQRLEEMARGS